MNSQFVIFICRLSWDWNTFLENCFLARCFWPVLQPPPPNNRVLLNFDYMYSSIYLFQLVLHLYWIFVILVLMTCLLLFSFPKVILHMNMKSMGCVHAYVYILNYHISAVWYHQLSSRHKTKTTPLKESP